MPRRLFLGDCALRLRGGELFGVDDRLVDGAAGRAEVSETRYRRPRAAPQSSVVTELRLIWSAVVRLRIVQCSRARFRPPPRHPRNRDRRSRRPSTACARRPVAAAHPGVSRRSPRSLLRSRRASIPLAPIALAGAWALASPPHRQTALGAFGDRPGRCRPERSPPNSRPQPPASAVRGCPPSQEWRHPSGRRRRRRRATRLPLPPGSAAVSATGPGPAGGARFTGR